MGHDFYRCISTKPDFIRTVPSHLGKYLVRSDRRPAPDGNPAVTTRLYENSPKIIIRYQCDRDQQGDERNYEMVGSQSEKGRDLTIHSWVPRTRTCRRLCRLIHLVVPHGEGAPSLGVLLAGDGPFAGCVAPCRAASASATAGFMLSTIDVGIRMVAPRSLVVS